MSLISWYRIPLRKQWHKIRSRLSICSIQHGHINWYGNCAIANIPRDKKYSSRKWNITRGNKIFPAEMKCKNIPPDPKIFVAAKRYSQRQKIFPAAEKLFLAAKFFPSAQKIFPAEKYSPRPRNYSPRPRKYSPRKNIPRGPQIIPRGPENIPRGKNIPRGPEIIPRGPEIIPRGPENIPRGKIFPAAQKILPAEKIYFLCPSQASVVLPPEALFTDHEQLNHIQCRPLVCRYV